VKSKSHVSTAWCVFVSVSILLPRAILAQAPQYTISTVAGNGTAGFSGDGGMATAAELFYPYKIALDSSGNLFIADQYNFRIRKVGTDGKISTVAGNGTFGFTGDGSAATSAEIFSPSGVAVDSAGDLYFTQTDTSGTTTYSALREVSGGNISTVVGGNSTTPLGSGYSGDGGPAVNAQLNTPLAVTLDGAGNLYITDTVNSAIREVTADGNINTIAGNGTAKYSGDNGPAGRASLNRPDGAAFDTAGNLYIADTHNYCVRVIKNGIISTFAGICGTLGFSGDNGPAAKALLNYPTDVAIDSSGNVYIADSNNYRIRMVTPSGTIYTIAGSTSPGSSGDGGPATSAQLMAPFGLAIGPNGVIYISDQASNVIRLLTPVLSAPSIDHAQSVSSCGAFHAAAAPGAWIEIYGSSLAPHARLWSVGDFNGATAPTSLDGTYATIAGQNAVLAYIGPGQVNAQVPLSTPVGAQQLIVTNKAGSSAAYAMTITATEAGLCQGLSFNGNTYVAAVVNGTSTYIYPSTANVAGVTSRPAQPGEILNLFGNGFGAVTPAPGQAQVVQNSNSLANKFTIAIGGINATIQYAGLAEQAIGLYQFNVMVPNIPDSDTVPVTFTLGGVAGTQTLFIAVHH